MFGLQSKTLKSINRARVALGGEPLTRLRPGFRKHPKKCPLANSLNDLVPNIQVRKKYVQGMNAEFARIIAKEFGVTLDVNDCVVVDLPVRMRVFVFMFDHGGYRQLAASW